MLLLNTMIMMLLIFVYRCLSDVSVVDDLCGELWRERGRGRGRVGGRPCSSSVSRQEYLDKTYPRTLSRVPCDHRHLVCWTEHPQLG